MSDFSLWFYSFYSRNNRFVLHGMMWLVFGVFVELGLLLSENFTAYSSLFFLVKSTVANAAFFYLFFYFVFPFFLLRRRFLTGILLVIALLFLWRSIDYLTIVLVDRYAHLGNTLLSAEIKQQVKAGYGVIYTPGDFFGGLIFIMASLSPVFCVKIISDVTLAAYKRSQSEKEKVLLEVSFLKSQLNPHFLFNTLNSIYILNMKKDKGAGDVILELSDTLRYTLYESNTEQVPLEKELGFLQNYVNLESVRHNKQTRINFNSDLSNTDGFMIAPLLTFPFIENAFKHGLGTSLKDAWLDITAKITGNTFHFNIKNSKNDQNNGKQLDEYTGGIGVSNTKKRLALLYPGKHILEIINTPDEYSVELMINLSDE